MSVKTVEEGSCIFCCKNESTLEIHIQTQTHNRAAKRLFCHFCGIQFFSDSEREQHRELEDHDKKSMQRCNHPLFNPRAENPQEELDQALKKLVYYLYYSNAYPYYITLEYIEYYSQKIKSNKDFHQFPMKDVHIASPLESILRQDQMILLNRDEEANSTRIQVLKKLESLLHAIIVISENIAKSNLHLLTKFVQKWIIDFYDKIGGSKKLD